MLSRFANEVLSQGASAVLPQNLNQYWLTRIQKYADDFLDANFAVGECVEKVVSGDPVLTACVHEVVRANGGPTLELTEGQLAENTAIYALSITMESIRRESDIEMTLPTLSNLLSVKRIVQFAKINPAFGQFLEKACLLPETEIPAERNWFKRLTGRIRSRMASFG